MKHPSRIALLLALTSAVAWSQEVSSYGTTMAQLWKDDTPGITNHTYAPFTQFLGIDATRLGDEQLSLHLFGWGAMDMAGSTVPIGSYSRNDADLTFGYLKYRFSQANAEIKVGRFMINQGQGAEQVDGASARADLRGGFTVSAFGGRSVLYKAQTPEAQADYEYQHDVIFGTRLGYRIPKMGEMGVSFLQDGSSPGRSLNDSHPLNFARKQMSFDLALVPVSRLAFTGRTTWDLMDRAALTTAGNPAPSRIAEHDYSLTYNAGSLFRIGSSFVQRDFQAYYSGTNMPSLFRQDERGKFKAQGLNMTLGSSTSWELAADYKKTHREIYGDGKRVGGEVRWTSQESLHLKAGVAYHRVTAEDEVRVGARIPAFSWSHGEYRAWAMYEGQKLSVSLDGIHLHYDDQNNPYLYGKSAANELIASLGYRLSPDFKISSDLIYGANAFAQKDVRGQVRAEYRFGKGGAR